MPVQQIPHLISRVGDPIFALFIGTTAAALRIRREEKEKGNEAGELWGILQRRLGMTEAM